MIKVNLTGQVKEKDLPGQEEEHELVLGHWKYPISEEERIKIYGNHLDDLGFMYGSCVRCNYFWG